MAKRNGLLPGEFLVDLHWKASVVIKGLDSAGHHRLLVDTPTAAEIIREIAESDAFNALDEEKTELQRIAAVIAARFSGH